MIGTVIVPRVPVTLALFTETVTVGSNAFTTAASFGTDVTFTSTSDSYVNEKKSTTNYGTDASMIVESRNANDKRAFVQFDVSSIPGTATVSTATLTLCTTAVTGGRTYNVHRVTSSWTQTGVTWVAQPTVAASATDSLVTPSTAGCMTWTVTADVQAWVDGSAVNNGLRVSDSVESVGGPGAGANDYRTLEDTAVPAEQPKLDVSYS